MSAPPWQSAETTVYRSSPVGALLVIGDLLDVAVTVSPLQSASRPGTLRPVGEDRRMRTTLLRTTTVALTVPALVAGCQGSKPKTLSFLIGGGAMANTLADGDRVQVELTSKVTRGDIIAFDGDKAGGRWDQAVVSPNLPNVFFKRVIGLGGDTIICPPIAPGSQDCAAVVVNGKPLDEAAYTYGTGNDAVSATKVQHPTHAFAQAVVPAGQIFVMGDHRDDSIDSREEGTIAATSVIGKVIGIVAPSSAPVSHSP
jgi:signal peptidase I